MRKASSYRQLFGWWEDAVAGRKPPRHEGDPQCGFYRTRMVKGGPFVPVRIFVERDIDPDTGELASPEILRMEIAGERGGDPLRHWTHLIPIPREEYDRLIEAHRTSMAMRATHATLDITATPARP
jgi:hypothetical protein